MRLDFLRRLRAPRRLKPSPPDSAFLRRPGLVRFRLRVRCVAVRYKHCNGQLMTVWLWSGLRAGQADGKVTASTKWAQCQFGATKCLLNYSNRTSLKSTKHWQITIAVVRMSSSCMPSGIARARKSAAGFGHGVIKRREVDVLNRIAALEARKRSRKADKPAEAGGHIGSQGRDHGDGQ
jgi:hypothetical protein